MDASKLFKLMEENPRLSSREYAELAAKEGLGDEIDEHELKMREIQKCVRRIARESKTDPQLAFVSIMEDRNGAVEEVYLPAKVCTETEAQRVLDDYASRIEGSMHRAMKLRDYWNGNPFNYQLTFNWG